MNLKSESLSKFRKSELEIEELQPKAPTNYNDDVARGLIPHLVGRGLFDLGEHVQAPERPLGG